MIVYNSPGSGSARSDASKAVLPRATIPRLSTRLRLRTARGICLMALCGCFAGGAVTAAAQETATAGEPSGENPKLLVAQLADPSYLRREIATRQLVAAGDAAVASLEEAIRQGDLELVERANAILQDLATLETPGDTNLAWEALSRLEKTGPAAAASRASAAKSFVRGERSRRARAQLEVAGVIVGPQEMAMGSQLNVWNAVRFPADWTPQGEVLKWLPWLYGPTTAAVEGSAASAEVLAAIGSMPNVRQVQIRDAELSAEAIEQLGKLKRIDLLELLFVHIGDEAADLAAIAELPLRHTLVLTGTEFDEADVEKLAMQLPGLEITFSRGGFLGVQCQPTGIDCRVQSVLPGSAADRANIQPRDVIVKLGDHKIQQFADLQKAVRRYTPEDQLEVTIVREGRRLVLPIQLGRQ